ncbi:hypothetical protein C470_03811 [Halorubrum distributum JCM 13561]|uniref:Uncharacterized protein n=1 Tax=Halorubrum distributum JCM 13561 TaxID=1227483 RepID=M0P066_9EURY|nr:hypothetical protein [Halorubrum litoreum]EMA63223.1 hypothetical protein C470_03811 [Halorubrum litoreum JCM 13561]
MARERNRTPRFGRRARSRRRGRGRSIGRSDETDDAGGDGRDDEASAATVALARRLCAGGNGQACEMLERLCESGYDAACDAT